MALELGDGIVLNEITGEFFTDGRNYQKNAFVWNVPGHGKFAFYGYSSPKVRDNKALAEFVNRSSKRPEGYAYHLPAIKLFDIRVKFPYDYTDAEALAIVSDDANIFDFGPDYESSFPKLDPARIIRASVASFTILPAQIKGNALYWRDAPVINPSALERSSTPVTDINDSLFGVYMLIDEPNGFYAEPEPSRLTYVLEYITAKLIDCFYNIYPCMHGILSNAVLMYNRNKMFSPAPLAKSPKYDSVDFSAYQEIDVASNTAEQYGLFLNYSRIYDGVCKYWDLVTRNAWGLSPMDGEVTISGIYAYLDKLISNTKNISGFTDFDAYCIAALMLLREQIYNFVNEIRSRGKSPDLHLNYTLWEFQEFWLYFMLIYSSIFFSGRSDSLLDDLFYVPPVRNPFPPHSDEESLGILLYDQIVLTPFNGAQKFANDLNLIHDTNASLVNLVDILRNPKGHIPTMEPPGEVNYETIFLKAQKWYPKLDDPKCPPEVLVFTNIYYHDDYSKKMTAFGFRDIIMPYEELQYRNFAIGSTITYEPGPDGQDIPKAPQRFKVHDSMPLLVYSLAFEKLYALKKAVPKDCNWWNSKAFEEYYNEVKKLRGGTPS